MKCPRSEFHVYTQAQASRKCAAFIARKFKECLLSFRGCFSKIQLMVNPSCAESCVRVKSFHISSNLERVANSRPIFNYQILRLLHLRVAYREQARSFSKISGDLIYHLNTQISGRVAARYSLRIAWITSFTANFSLCSLCSSTSDDFCMTLYCIPHM